eukprot:XP_014052050.1 PREDICTED: uncharacterized protein LOC106603216 isoform X3 [Salmo salar]
MGRRAADLTTAVPVLGVPALVGVRDWRTVGGERAGEVLPLTWGPQCSIGVQTSPGSAMLQDRAGSQGVLHLSEDCLYRLQCGV